MTNPGSLPVSAVWIDADEARIATCEDVAGNVHRRDRRRRDRAGHLREFLEAVAAAVPDHGDVDVLGPDLIRERLVDLLARADRHRGRRREIRSCSAGPMTDRQLDAWLRERAGDPPRRRGVESEA